MTNIKSYIIFLCLLSVAVLSCTKNDGTGRNPCLEPKKYFLKLQANETADTGTAGQPVNLPSPVVGLVDTPVLFITDTIAANTFQGSLSVLNDSTRWFIQPDTNNPAGRDTIVFYYNRVPVFLSTACGYTFVFSLQDVAFTNNSIDSARIEIVDVTNDVDNINVKIFY